MPSDLRIVPYRESGLAAVPDPPRRRGPWARFRTWWRGVGWGVKVEVHGDGSKVDILIEVPGSDPNIRMDKVSWELLEQVQTLLEATADGDEMMVQHKDQWDRDRVVILPPNCLPKLLREVSRTLHSRRVMLSVQGGRNQK